MIGKVFSAAVMGIMAESVEIEADIAPGIPSFELTGNLSSTVREARERVRIALKNSNFKINPSRITINFTPANIYKDGTHFDLAMAVAILSSVGYMEQDLLQNTFFIGELGLDGHVCRVKAVLPMIICAKEHGMKLCFVPKENEKEASIIRGIKIIGVESLQQCVMVLNGKCQINDVKTDSNQCQKSNSLDYFQIKGLSSVKRAIVIAASALHNILMIGPPGSGKSAVAARISTILPELDYEDMIRITSTYSVAGLLNQDTYIIDERPFRAPHHTITTSAFSGGGLIPTPGEMSLADTGVLFLDEINLFKNEVIDAMRLPLEEHRININRIHGKYRYPANFMLVAAMNPCPCGFYPDKSRCNCRENDIRRYFGKINKPILDRIDMCIQVTKSSYEDITGNEADSISSHSMSVIVNKCFEIQKERYKNTDIKLNSRLEAEAIKKYCPLSKDASRFMKLVFDKYDLSTRGYYKTIRVARTIADIADSEIIEESHICEAIGYKLV